MSIYNNILQTIGNTPILKLNKIAKGLPANLYLKCEFFNPLFSVKDRIGMAMIDAAEKDGSLKPGGIVIEPTSGNTGIALAFVCATKGYKCLLTMPETMSVERRVLLRMLGADIVLTPGPKGMTGAIAKASELLDQHGDGAFMPQQFNNPANPEIHRRTTAEEIWNATEGKIDVLISGIGTGGTITGVSEVIKSRKQLTSIAVEPKDSPILSGGKPGPHKIQGIGAGFVPNVLNIDIIDDIVQVGNDDAFETARNVSITDGIPAGISTGAAISAGIEVAKRSGMEDKMIVIIGASPTERYLSTALAEKARTESAAMTAVEI